MTLPSPRTRPARRQTAAVAVVVPAVAGVVAVPAVVAAGGGVDSKLFIFFFGISESTDRRFSLLRNLVSFFNFASSWDVLLPRGFFQFWRVKGKKLSTCFSSVLGLCSRFFQVDAVWSIAKVPIVSRFRPLLQIHGSDKDTSQPKLRRLTTSPDERLIIGPCF